VFLIICLHNKAVHVNGKIIDDGLAFFQLGEPTESSGEAIWVFMKNPSDVIILCSWWDPKDF